MLIHKQKESSSQRQFSQCSLFFLNSTPCKIHYEHFSGCGGGFAHYHNFLLSLSVVTNLMMIIWFILIIFCFRGHICSRLVSVSWKLHLQAFSRHIEELSFMETSGFSTCKWGLAFLLPRGLIFCYWKYISTVWEKFYVGRLGRMSNASEKSFWEMRVCR